MGRRRDVWAGMEGLSRATAPSGTLECFKEDGIPENTIWMADRRFWDKTQKTQA